MEMHGLEGILETLLVGAIVAVCLLSFLFLLFGHVFRVEIVRRPLKFLLYEARFEEAEPLLKVEEAVRVAALSLERSGSQPPPALPLTESARPAEPGDELAAQPSPSPRSLAERHAGSWLETSHASPRAAHHRASKEKHEEPSELSERAKNVFLIVLSTALLYGLGIMAENISDQLVTSRHLHFKDDSFERIGAAHVRGGMSSPAFARFFTDVEACATLYLTPEHDSKSGVKPAPHALCDQLAARKREFYYTAKNTSYLYETFQRELAQLQSRINFARSTMFSLGVLMAELVIALLLATGAEQFLRRVDVEQQAYLEGRRSKPPGRFLAFYAQFAPQARSTAPPPPGWRGQLAELVMHWGAFDAVRCFLFILFFAVFFGLSWLGWQGCEEQFDNRVFGYFFALQQPAAPESKSEAGKTGEAPAPIRTPESPYRVFGLTDQRPFEASAVRFLPESSHVLVANDKGGAQAFVLFEHTAEGLVHPRSVKPPAAALDDKPYPAASFLGIPKIEAFDVTEQGDLVDVFTVPSVVSGQFSLKHFRFGTAEAKHVEAADPADGGKPPAASESSEEHGDALVATEISEKLVDPAADWCSSFLDPPSNAGVCEIEGLTRLGTTTDPQRLLLGVRQVGKSHRADNPVLGFVELVKAPGVTGQESSWSAREPKLAPKGKIGEEPCAGVSDLEYKDGVLYVLTSVELDDGTRCAAPRVPNPETKNDGHETVAAPESQRVKGALYAVQLIDGKGELDLPALAKSESWRLLERLIHKPEGVTRLGGALLVVFDDDASRKGVDMAPARFPLEDNQSEFALLRVPR